MQKAAEALMPVVLLLFLAIGAIWDYRKRELAVFYIAAGFGAGILLRILAGSLSLSGLALSLLPGLALCLISAASRKRIGAGDGAMVLCTGAYLAPLPTVTLLFLSLLAAGLCGALLLWLKRKRKEQELPFIPFLLCGYVIFLSLS